MKNYSELIATPMKETYEITCNHTRNYFKCQRASGCIYLEDTRQCTCDYGYGLNQNGKCEQCINNTATDLPTRKCSPCSPQQVSFYGHICVTPQQCNQMNGYVNEEKKMCKCQPSDVMDPFYGCISYQHRLDAIKQSNKRYSELKPGQMLAPNYKDVITQGDCIQRNGHILTINPKQCICKGAELYYYEHKNYCVYPYNTKFFEPTSKRDEFLEKYLIIIVIVSTVLFCLGLAVLSIFVNDCVEQRKQKKEEALKKQNDNNDPQKDENEEGTVQDNKKED